MLHVVHIQFLKWIWINRRWNWKRQFAFFFVFQCTWKILSFQKWKMLNIKTIITTAGSCYTHCILVYKIIPIYIVQAPHLLNVLKARILFTCIKKENYSIPTLSTNRFTVSLFYRWNWTTFINNYFFPRLFLNLI